MRAPTLIAILLASASCATGLLQPEANNLNATLAEVMARLDQMQGAMQAQQQVTRGQGDMAAALHQAYDRIARLESKAAFYEERLPQQFVYNASALSPVSDDPLPGEIKLFQSKDCPTGWQPVSKAQGFMLVGTPADGDTMTQIGTPLKNNEKGRVGPHTHDIIDNGHSHDIEDNGHSHDVDDPGHSHTIPAHTSGGDTNSADNESGEQTFDTGVSTTNIQVQSSESGIDVSGANSGVKVQENDDSDYYPLLYVLVCNKV